MKFTFPFWLKLLLTLASGTVAASEECIGCHEQEVAEWKGSHHKAAMASPDEQSVLGNFEGAEFSGGDVHVIFHREGPDFVMTVSEEAERTSYPVAYTFGIYPLQQYLIDIGDGRLQAFNVAWDSRPAGEGGQRWFRLDEADDTHPGDPFHWSGIYQNWNNQCASCHTMGLSRNYDSLRDQYSTVWDQAGVGCESCHESAGEHAEAERQGAKHAPDPGLAAMGRWFPSDGDQSPRHEGQPSSAVQVPTCGRCHSLRTPLADEPGGQVHEEYRLALLNEPLYYADGAVREEVFVLGSFEQSKMFQQGVVCSDCHNPHSGELKLEGNAVCAQCHKASDYDIRQHHHHSPESSGAQCVNCHMPESTFMKVDDRREHSFKVPRPDVSEQSSSPDVCLGCHEDKTSDWSKKTVGTWAPHLFDQPTWFHDQRQPFLDILRMIEDPERPVIERATLLARHGPQAAQEVPALLHRMISSDHPMLRATAIGAAGADDSFIDSVRKRLEDETLNVRLAAAEFLIQAGQRRAVSAPVLEEYEHFLDMDSDLPAGRARKARYFLATDRVYRAEQELRVGLDKDPGHVQSAILLADILRSGHRNDEAVEVLSDALAAVPRHAGLVHVRGLTQLALRNYPQALADLEQAWQWAADEWLYGYRYAVALYRLDQVEKARNVLEPLRERFPDVREVRQLAREIAP